MGGYRCDEDIGEGLLSTIDKESDSRGDIFADAVIETPVNELASPQNEFHGHKALTLGELGSVPALRPSENVADEEEDDDLPEYDWDEHTAHQLKGLLTNKMLSIFQTAIKKVVDCGYSEVAAGWAVLNSGLSRGDKDVVSNIVNGAVNLLKTEKECNIPKKPVFDGLRSMVEYFVLEMTNVILEARPELTIADAMRCLLRSDMNLSRASLCPVEEGASGTSDPGNQNPGEKPMPDSTSSCPNSTPIPRPPLHPPNCTTLPGKKWEKSPIILKEMRDQLCLARDQIRASAQAAGATEVSQKANSKKEKSRLKVLQLEKDHKNNVSQDAYKAKISALGSMVLEKSLKSQSNLLTKITVTNSSKPGVPAPTLPFKASFPASAEAKSINSPQDPRLKAKTTHVSEPLKDIDYYAGIPYDEALQKHIPQDEKDKYILALLPHKQELEKKIQYWSDWAKEKVMEATKRLTQDQGELKRLRQEKEVDEKFNNEKQIIEDSVKKRILEMETALSKAVNQIDVANSYFHRLKEENSSLRKRMGTCNLRATEAHQYWEEAVEREQDAIMKCQLSDNEKGLYLDQLDGAKNELVELNNRMEKMKEQEEKFQVLLRKEEREKLKAIAKYESLVSKREEDEVVAVVEAESITRMAEMNIKKTKEDMKNLENLISELRLKAERSKIAALKIGYGSSSSSSDDFFTFRALQVPKISKSSNNFGRGRARECIMCMNEEISVVFLPCAHQVLCVECNILHEKQGMNGCPSCRTTIQKRIPIKYRPV